MPHKGKVKWFNAAKGYGFIQPDDENEEDIFVHFTAIEVKDPRAYRELHPEDEVEYEKGEGAKGPQAMKVHVVSAAGGGRPSRDSSREDRRGQEDRGSRGGSHSE